jgi:glycine oxidase
MRTQSDILIVGGGVIGLTTAYVLARERVSVIVVDRSAPGSEASWAGAGIIPPGNPDRAVTAYDRLRAMSSCRFPAFSAELRERTGIDNGYRVCGGIDVFESIGHPAPRLWEHEGIEFTELSPEAQHKLEPHACFGGVAFLLPGMAQVRNPWHLRALAAACGRAGVIIESGREVAELQKSANRIEGVIFTDGTRHGSRQCLIAAGAWSDQLLGKLGRPVGIHPVKGQIVLFRSPRPLVQRIISFDKRYLVPRDDGRILVGSTEEPEAGFDKQPTKHGVGELVRFATSVVPELANVEIETTWAGLRPGTPNGLPFLGRIDPWDNAYVATGHFRAGIQLSIGTAMVMSDLLLSRPSRIPLDEFRLDRPRSSPAVMAFRS